MLGEKLLEAAGNAAPAANYIEDVFSTWLSNGNSSTQNIVNGIDLSTKGGMVWFKARSNAVNNSLFDTARGATKRLISNATTAEQTSSDSLTSFNVDGFSLGADTTWNSVNTSGVTYASWAFRKQPKFFDVQTISHTSGTANTVDLSGLGTVGCVIVKQTNGAQDWFVWHRSLTAGNLLYLNGTVGQTADNNISVSGTTLTMASGATTGTYVVYAYAHNAGGFGLTGTDNVISCGSFTTNGSGNATVNLGYEPQWVLSKCTGSAGGDDNGDWRIVDSMREFPAPATNVTYAASATLFPNTSGAEVFQGFTACNSTGFSAGQLQASKTYIYIAIRRGPMKVPTDATKVFAPVTGTPTNNFSVNAGFPPDLSFVENRTNGVTRNTHDRLRGGTTTSDVSLQTSSTGAEQTYSGNGIGFNSIQNGIVDNFTNFNQGSGQSMVYWNFRRAPNFFDDICYTGIGLAGTTFNHNLQVQPELWIIKSRSNAYDWYVGSTQMTSSEYVRLNFSDPKDTSAIIWNNTYPSSTVITFGYAGGANASGVTYVGYFFASCPGVSKVGKYTGTGTLTTINCGFSSGARFLLIKRLDSSADWFVWDTTRGMVAGTDPSLSLNTTAAESNANSVYTIASGFQLLASPAADVNTSGGTYLYLAIA